MDKSYNFQENEDKIYKHWEKAGFFNPDNLKLAENAPAYTIVLPPPNVTGTLHMGHAGVLTFEDILIRYHRMKGERALWVPGTDHAAIATQTKVEKIIKKEGESRHSLGREKFLQRVRQFAQDSHDTIVSQCKKMGASLDWSREAYTLDETRNKAVNSVFQLMYEDGLIYRGERIVNWCPRCHSPLADDEVEYQENKAFLYYFKYDHDFPLTIATTRPETKLGDTAVALNPQDKRYAGLVGREFQADFAGIKLKLKIIADRNVDMEFGAGALGVTPAHSAIDWQMAADNGLPIKKVIDEDGKIRSGFGQYSGQTALKAREMILDNLRTAGLLEKEEPISHNLSLCYRCDTPVEPLPSRQWFIDVNKKISRLEGKSLKQTSLEAVRSGVFGRKKIRIIPERFEKNYFHWMENLRDWCISRQIWFGHQIPVWYRESEVHVGPDAPAGKDWTRDADTLDTWFSSGMWTFSTLAQSPDQIQIKNGRLAIDSPDFQKFHPTQVLETAYDILFFWVARMILMTTYAIKDIPFQDVYLQGLVTDEKGKKMSKSKGNVINPLDMAEKYGADAVRLSLVIGSAPGHDMKLSEEKISGFRNLVNKLWNIARYIRQKTAAAPLAEESADMVHSLAGADFWIISKMKELIKEVSLDLDNYRFSQAGEKLREFTWNDLADWYLEAAKFSDSKQTGPVLLAVLEDLLKLWHPFMPFVTETIWKDLKGSDLIIADWPSWQKYPATNEDGKLAGFELAIEIIKSIRNARAENKTEPSRKIDVLIHAGERKKDLWENQAIIKSLRTGIDNLEIKSQGDKPEKAVFLPITADIEVYLIGAIDEKKELLRLEKTITRLDQQISALKKTLADQSFIKNAPPAIIEKEKNRQKKYQAEKTKLAAQLSELKKA